MLPPPKDDMWVEGRVKGIEFRDADATVWVITGPGQVDEIVCPPWRLEHCHHQPVVEYITINGKRLKQGAADDSLAWRMTREAIAKAMMSQGPPPRRLTEDA